MDATLISNRYRLETEIGRGGMGAVFRAQDLMLDRPVAVKVFERSDAVMDRSDRFLREAQAAARLNHPNIVTVFDAGVADGVPFIVMELVEGRNLYESKPSDLIEILAISRQICSALEHAHQHGIIHRDLKPENVLITPSGTAKLMDFGLARSVTSRLSKEGVVVGTVLYMAPELILGQSFDGRADLYALGVMIYELAAGRLPFEADDPLAVISQHLYAPVVPPATYNPRLPPALDNLVVRLLEKTPADRPSSARQVEIILLEIESAGELLSIEAGSVHSLLSRIARGRLVGRTAEIGILRQHWESTMQGSGHLVLISGEPGVGKTRLADELIAYVRLQGGIVLKGGCYEYEAATPYLPLVEALRSWVHDQATEELQQALGDAAAEITRLVPEIETRLGPQPPNPSLPQEQERLRLFDNLANFFQKLASEKGLLLFIDDLHWGDHGTLALLHYLLRRLRGERVMILSAYREVELDRSHPLAAALVEWNRERLVTRIQLGRLSFEECGNMLAGMFGQQQVSEEFTRVIYKETEGNPFFIEEVIKALVEQGQIYREDGRWQRLEIEELAIPQSIKEAIGRRLNKLSQSGLSLLQYAAFLGKVFDFNELAAVYSVDAGQPPQLEDQMLNALDESLSAQLIRSLGGETFAFTHDKIREVLYEELNPIRRRRFHQRTGDLLEKLYSGQAIGAHVQDLAYHFLQSGDLNKALRYSLTAAQEARRIYAHQDSLRYYQHAAECAEALNDSENLVEIYEAIGSVFAAQGMVYPAVENFERALALAETPEKRVRMKTRIGTEYTQVGDARGLEYLHAAQRELDPENQSRDLAYVLAMLGRYHHYQAQHNQAVSYLRESLQLAEPLDDALLLTFIYAFLAGAYQHLGRFSESMHWGEQSILLGERKENLQAVASGHEFLAEDYMIMGIWDKAIHHAQLYYQIGEKIGDQSRQVWAKYSMMVAYYNQGFVLRALETGQEIQTTIENIGENRLMIWLYGQICWFHTDLCDDQAAVSYADKALEQANQLNQVILKSHALAAQAYFYLAIGQWGRVVELFEQAEALYRPSENRLAPLFIVPLAAQAYLAINQVQRAEQILDEYLRSTEEIRSSHWNAIGLRVYGQLQAAQGHWEAAGQTIDQSIDRLERLGTRLELGRSFYHRAMIYRKLGQAEAAKSAATQARSLFESCQAQRDFGVVDSLLMEL